MEERNLVDDKLISEMLRHGAQQVETQDLLRESVLVWSISEGTTVSRINIRLDELMSSAARNCKSALDVIKRIDTLHPVQDPDLFAALKKYVEDTCEAIKVADNELRDRQSGLADLLQEYSGGSTHSDATWKNLIGRRDVIAHQILTVDEQRVYDETKRDFHSLYSLISRVYFVPTKTDLDNEVGFQPLFRTELIKDLTPAKVGESMRPGNSLIFICDDATHGFLSLKMGKTENNLALIAASKPIKLSLSVFGIGSSVSE